KEKWSYCYKQGAPAEAVTSFQRDNSDVRTRYRDIFHNTSSSLSLVWADRGSLIIYEICIGKRFSLQPLNVNPLPILLNLGVGGRFGIQPGASQNLCSQFNSRLPILFSRFLKLPQVAIAPARYIEPQNIGIRAQYCARKQAAAPANYRLSTRSTAPTSHVPF